MAAGGWEASPGLETGAGSVMLQSMKMNRFLATLLGLMLGVALVQAEETGVRADGRPPFKNVTVKEFDKMRSDTNVVVLDVRMEKEFTAGHVPGAKLLDVNTLTFERDVAKLDKSKTYLVHCAAGVRSMKACNIMSGLGFTNLYNLKPGYKGWVAEGNQGVK